MPQQMPDSGYQIILLFYGVAVFSQIHDHLKPQNMTLVGILSLAMFSYDKVLLD